MDVLVAESQASYTSARQTQIDSQYVEVYR
jgi:hypothetical protein